MTERSEGEAPCAHTRRDQAARQPPGTFRCLDCGAIGQRRDVTDTVVEGYVGRDCLARFRSGEDWCVVVGADDTREGTDLPVTVTIGAHPPDSERSASIAMQDDMADLLRVLGLGDHARPVSPHEVMQSEIIPAVQALMGGGG